MKWFLLVLATVASGKAYSAKRQSTVDIGDPVSGSPKDFFDDSTPNNFGGISLNLSVAPVQVRIIPNGLLCAGFFIDQNLVVTTAKCVLGKTPTELYVSVRGEREINKTYQYQVKNVVIHDGYRALLNKNNVAMLVLKNRVKQVITIYKLPQDLDKDDVPGKVGQYFRWTFVPTFVVPRPNEYFTHYENKIISSAECSVLKNQLIDCDKVCVNIENMKNSELIVIRPGPFDAGSPLGIRLASRDYRYLVGIYTGDFMTDISVAQVFEDAFHLFRWLNRTAKTLSGKHLN